MYRQIKRLGLWAGLIMMALGLLAGCSSTNSSMSDSDSGISSYAAEDSEAVANTESTEGQKGSSEDVAGGGLSSESVIAAEGFNQKIIYTATLSMRVNDLAAAATELQSAIQQSGGYILQFQDTRHDGEIGSSYMIKVPAAGFMPFIDRLEEIEHSAFARNIGGKDVSEEYVDLASRLKARQLVETRLLNMMDKAVEADDLLKFSQQLSEVQLEIERIKGRIRYLDTNIAFSTVELQLYQTSQSLTSVRAGEESLGQRISSALTGSTKFVWEGLKQLLVIAAGALPVLVVLAVIAVPVLWFVRRRNRITVQEQPIPEEEQPKL
ncbi:DUF4349 domain-containing protein [Paenibacillus sp. sgz302251]|uniref:DUF4349 domain-containing protein n=1 Tax=Paenibacillus sp. sgz302251 TaxID=3414493 RepID=UPI003C7E7FF8